MDLSRISLRVLALVGLLVVPVMLALASQSLAKRPGPPDLDDVRPVVLTGTTGSAPSPGAPPADPAPSTVPGGVTTRPAEPTSGPEPGRAEDADAGEDRDDEGDDD